MSALLLMLFDAGSWIVAATSRGAVSLYCMVSISVIVQLVAKIENLAGK
jgi:hypothetical protein